MGFCSKCSTGAGVLLFCATTEADLLIRGRGEKRSLRARMRLVTLLREFINTAHVQTRGAAFSRTKQRRCSTSTWSKACTKHPPPLRGCMPKIAARVSELQFSINMYTYLQDIPKMLLPNGGPAAAAAQLAGLQ